MDIFGHDVVTDHHATILFKERTHIASHFFIIVGHALINCCRHLFICYGKLFRIDSIPRMVLISPAGKVLYNGHPNDPKLWAELKKLAPDLTEPKEEGGDETGEEE